jgi:hypothetical protein
VAKCASGDYEGSSDDFASSIEFEPKNVKAHILMGKARGDFKKGCYNPLKDKELLLAFQGVSDAINKEIIDIESIFI